MSDSVNWDMVVQVFAVVANLAAVVLIVFAVLQLRAMTTDRETDLTIKVFDRFRDPVFLEAHDWLTQNANNLHGGIDYFSDDGRRARRVAIVFEEAGTLLKIGSMRSELILSLISGLVVSSWKTLEVFITAERVRQNDRGLWENFEYLKDESLKFQQRSTVKR